ncbi:hypothetical protein [Aeoliella mucimassa]|uniref:Lipoprotein n=1 Tax=Aeoliella mucimassa TaxID=2527972 RepID=A0A518AVX4_9BACT|nr:hypothetical protein [Aeoliella mucimassa]QDU58858.1 hypothetical protein Pan181_50980 [Aeoliella mucimassa]
MFRRTITCLLLLFSLAAGTGCMSWRMPKFNLNDYRDPRAVDIDSRLADPPPQD